MKMPGLQHSVACHVKVRYKQDVRPAVLHPEGETGARVDFDDLFAPGQLAVFYDSDGAVLCAGTIELLQGDCGARASCLS
jgi:tRNA U34 2-thiouridine synthase MnmA/TrmU